MQGLPVHPFVVPDILQHLFQEDRATVMRFTADIVQVGIVFQEDLLGVYVPMQAVDSRPMVRIAI